MDIWEKQKLYKKNFQILDDAASQSEYLIRLGIKYKGNETIQRPQYRIEGCKTAIWVKCEEDERSVSFQADSDSLLVKGMLFIFDDLYQGCSVAQVVANPPEFMDEISENVIYTEIKQNGLSNCYKKIAHIKK